jgi:CheY-like chemotaxis protein
VAAVIVIGASNLLSSLCSHLSNEGELVTFADTEPIQALQAMLERRPTLIVLERLFAATPRGAALINRIKTDPHLASAQLRVMSHTGDYTRQIARSAVAEAVSAVAEAAAAHGLPDSIPATAVIAEPHRPLDWHGTRRAERHRLRSGVEIQLDGNTVSVIDLSVVGAQVLSNTILRPNQKVRVTIPQEDTLVRCRGAVAWAKFELPQPSSPPIYRAGVEFIDADKGFVEQFSRLYRA